MDMGDGSTSSAPLNDTGVDFSNETQALNFLGEILDDTFLQIDGNNAATNFWYGIAVVLGLAALCNLVWTFTLWTRLRLSHSNRPSPARPRNFLAQCVATTTAILREATYLQITPTAGAFWVKIPPFGSLMLIAAYLGFILALEFINIGVEGAQYYQALGVRAGWLAVAQVPLIVLLAGKNNLVGLLCGVSYERLNVYHRWIARGLLLLATFHFGFQSHGWNVYGLMQLEWDTDTCPPTGIAAYALLLWINLTTLAPFRHISYEFFVIQHLLTFFGFIIAVMMHLPTTALYSRVYIYVPIGFYLVDRLVRTGRFIFHNFRPSRATLECLDGGVTKIRVSNCRIKKWRPGSHVLLALPRHGVAQSHPATIISTPQSHGGDLVFIMRAFKGFTRSILKASEAAASLPPAKESADPQAKDTYVALLDGPYGAAHGNFACFDTLFLIAGGTGVTFTLSTLLGVADLASSSRKLPLRTIRFIWMVKRASWRSWISEELHYAAKRLTDAGIDLNVEVFVTCDDSLIQAPGPRHHGGSCCCDGICNCAGVSDDPENPDEGSSEKGVMVVESSSPVSPVDMKPGRPEFSDLLWDTLCQAEGETAIGVCGPLGLSVSVRSAVVKMSDERAVHKGTGAQGMYLHVETFN